MGQTSSKLARLGIVPFALAFVAVIRLLRPWVTVRIGELWSARLGHLVGNTECYLAQKKGNEFDIWWHNSPISNETIAKKYAEVLHIWPAWFMRVASICDRLFAGYQIAAPLQYDRDITNAWRKPHLKFTRADWVRGRKLLRDLGIPKGAKWVCLIVRDEAYLKEKMPNADMSYHDFRNADVDSYLPAARYVASLGYYVLRMGNITSKRMVDEPKIIDYANSALRSDFGALFLGAHCEFCFGTSCGFMVIPQVFKRPCAVTDFVPLEYISTFCRDRVILKQHWKDGKRLAMREIVDAGVGQSTNGNDFKEAGIELRGNTPEEICDLVREMVEGEETDQSEFWKAYPMRVSNLNALPLHGAIKCRIGQKYLEAWKASSP